nr:helix-turn-helix domain-containing protein [Halomonas sp. UBA3074]
MPTESDSIAHLRIAVAMRAVRGALGVNQAEFAKLIGVSKPTVARVETLEAGMRLDTYANMLKKLKEIGVVVDTLYSENVRVEFEPNSLESLMERLSDQGQRRQDRKQTGVGVMKPIHLSKERQEKVAKRTQDTLKKMENNSKDSE